MPDRNVYHVVPSGERWGVRLEGAPALAVETDDQKTAIDQASDYVRQLGQGRVVVHAESGQIETVHTVDRLPEPSGSWTDALRSGPVLAAVGAFALAALVVGLRRRR